MQQAQLTTSAKSENGSEQCLFYCLLLLSLVLHLLFMLWPLTKHTQNVSLSALSILLQSSQPAAAADDQSIPRQQRDTTGSQLKTSPTEKHVPPVKTPVSLQHLPQELESHQRSQAASNIADHPPEPFTSRSSETITQTDEQALIRILQLELVRHFHYPGMARRRGWQGEVRLRFELDSNGNIHHAHIVRSSGYSLLDRAALTSLQQISTIHAQIPTTRQMELPIIYRLQEG